MLSFTFYLFPSTFIIMRDQADQLRNLVLRAARERVSSCGPAPRLIVLTGGKGGVGTTTLSVNLSVALAQQGQRVVLVDANPTQADVAPLCGLDERYSVSDVLQSRRNIHEVLEPGPAGIQVVPGCWAPKHSGDISSFAQQRLIAQLTSLGRHADLVVLDCGSGSSEIVKQYWQAADQVLLVTTEDSVSIMDAYATIKLLFCSEEPVSISTLVNQSVDERTATDVHRRIDTSCGRFLGLRIAAAGHVPLDSHVPAAAAAGAPLLVQSPTCEAARAIDRLAAVIGSQSSSRAAA